MLGLPGKFKEILFYVHQNFLLIAQIIVGRLPPQSVNNIWAHSLLAQILNKKAHTFNIKSSKFDLITSQKVESQFIQPMLEK